MLHELGHAMGLNDQPWNAAFGGCGGQGQQYSVMNYACGTEAQPWNDTALWLPNSPQYCDNAGVNVNYGY